MDARKLLVIASLAMLLVVQPVQGQTAQSNAAVAPMGLGFSQGTVTPVSNGVPVYTVGDQLWFEFYDAGAVSITLTEPCATGTSASNNCQGWSFAAVANTTKQLFTFSAEDPTGLWTLTADSGGEGWVVPFYLVSGGAPIQLSGYGVGSNGTFSMNYTLDSASAYDIGACTAGNQSTATAYVPVPATLGGGTLLFTLNGSSVSAIPQQTSGQFSVSLGLSQDYSYQVDNESAVTRDIRVAQTEPVLVSGGLTGAFSTALQDQVPLRTGEATLSVSFEGAQGTSVQETSVLITGTGSWVWLQGCSSATDRLSTTVTVSASLQNGPSVWPRYVYVLYQELGVNLFSVAPVTLQPSTVILTASQWGHKLTDSQVGVSGALLYSSGNGTAYLLGSQYPLVVSVSTPQTSPQQVEVLGPYTATPVSVPANQIVVRTLSGTTPLSGIAVSLTDSEGVVFVENSTLGTAVFYAPPGNFTVSGSYGGNPESSNVDTSGVVGQSFQTTLQFATAGGDWLTLLLLALLGVGAVASVGVWIAVYRRQQLLVSKRKPGEGSAA